MESENIELSIVIPCLNEADTLEICLTKAYKVLELPGLCGEVIIADNGSTDGSQEIARKNKARVVEVPEKGYGHALMAGIAASQGRFIIMGDADDSYDFLEIPKFLEKLRKGFDLVQGCRLPSGGGKVMRGAMPFSHRWCGNPLLSMVARWWFHVPVHDVYCGMRGFTKELYNKINQRCTGMEFAPEMILKSNMYAAKITEVPITLHPDGRKSHSPHLRTFRDGWRTLRFFLLYSPRWLFLVPGMFLILFGVFGYCIAMPGITVGTVNFDAHTLLFASLSILCGYQSILFSILAKTFAMTEGLIPEDKVMVKFFQFATLERCLIISFSVLCVGLALLLFASNQWRLSEFGPLDYAETMRFVVPGATLTALGFQTILSSFFISMLGISRSESFRSDAS